MSASKLSSNFSYLFVGYSPVIKGFLEQGSDSLRISVICRNKVDPEVEEYFPQVNFLPYEESPEDVLPNEENRGKFVSKGLRDVVLDSAKKIQGPLFVLYLLKYADTGLLDKLIAQKGKNDVVAAISSFLTYDVAERYVKADSYDYYLNKSHLDGVPGLVVLKLAHFIPDVRVDKKGLHVDTWAEGVFPTEWEDVTKRGKAMSLTPVSYIERTITLLTHMVPEDAPKKLDLISHSAYSIEERRIMAGRVVPTDELLKAKKRDNSNRYREISLKTTKRLKLTPLDHSEVEDCIRRATKLYDENKVNRKLFQ